MTLYYCRWAEEVSPFGGDGKFSIEERHLCFADGFIGAPELVEQSTEL
jgi:hypothetical protein